MKISIYSILFTNSIDFQSLSILLRAFSIFKNTCNLTQFLISLKLKVLKGGSTFELSFEWMRREARPFLERISSGWVSKFQIEGRKVCVQCT